MEIVIRVVAAAGEVSKTIMRLEAVKVAVSVVAHEIAPGAPTGKIRKSNCRRAYVTKYSLEVWTTP